VKRTDGSVLINVFNTGEHPVERLVSWDLATGSAVVSEDGAQLPVTDGGVLLVLEPFQSRVLEFK
jgi:alpha-galactosidase